MNVYGHSQAARFLCDEPEEKVLQPLVVAVRRLAPWGITRVDSGRVRLRRLGKVKAPEIRRLELYRNTTATLLGLERGDHNGCEIGIERRRKLCEMQVGQIPAEQLVLERKQFLSVG